MAEALVFKHHEDLRYKIESFHILNHQSVSHWARILKPQLMLWATYWTKMLSWVYSIYLLLDSDIPLMFFFFYCIKSCVVMGVHSEKCIVRQCCIEIFQRRKTLWNGLTECNAVFHFKEEQKGCKAVKAREGQHKEVRHISNTDS
jgi:hypothetical protein